MFMVLKKTVYLIYALLSQIKFCRDYALFEGHFLLKFGVWGQKKHFIGPGPNPSPTPLSYIHF